MDLHDEMREPTDKVKNTAVRKAHQSEKRGTVLMSMQYFDGVCSVHTKRIIYHVRIVKSLSPDGLVWSASKHEPAKMTTKST